MTDDHDPVPSLDSPPAFQPLHFDVREYMQFVEDEDLTEAQAEDLLRTVWEIVVAFVDIAYGIHPAQQVLVDGSRETTGSLPGESRNMLSSKDTFSEIANPKTAARDAHEPAAKEDS